MTAFHDWLRKMPKAELHLHIDGSLQAHRLLQLAEKNKVKVPYSSVEEVEKAYNFKDLQSFLDLYYLGASVLREEEDFYWLMRDYLEKCREQHIVHCEIMVEPQTYKPYGVELETVVNGFQKAIGEARATWGQSALMILSFLRHLSENEAIVMLHEAETFRQNFTAIGLASSEVGNPPGKFERLYTLAKAQGYQITAHAGEEGPASFIWDSITKLNVDRIDHGVRCVEDPVLVDYLVENDIPLTVCPLSNVRLCVFEKLEQHNILELLDRGVRVTVNSDDPAYFGGFVNENFVAMADALALDKKQAKKLAQNSFESSFLTPIKKRRARGL